MQARTPKPGDTLGGFRNPVHSRSASGDTVPDIGSSGRNGSRSGQSMGSDHHSDSGSGTAVGVAMMFPMLVMLIMILQALTESARITQTLQTNADRAAYTAALCCQYTGTKTTDANGNDIGDGAVGVALASLRAAEKANSFNNVSCNNNLANDSETVFIDANGNNVAAAASTPIPLDGFVYVFLTCRLPPRFGFSAIGVEHRVVGISAVDPYRYRVRSDGA